MYNFGKVIIILFDCNRVLRQLNSTPLFHMPGASTSAAAYHPMVDTAQGAAAVSMDASMHASTAPSCPAATGPMPAHHGPPEGTLAYSLPTAGAAAEPCTDAPSSTRAPQPTADHDLFAAYWGSQSLHTPAPNVLPFAPSAPVSKDPEEYSYAEAVLAALPSTDETVRLAQMAADAGQTLDEVVRFNYSAYTHSGRSEPESFRTIHGTLPPAPSLGHRFLEDHSVSVVQDPRNRSLRAVSSDSAAPPSAVAGALYSELRSWCNVESLESQLEEAARRRQRGLPPSVWKQLKAKKQQMKLKQRMQ